VAVLAGGATLTEVRKAFRQTGGAEPPLGT